MPVRKVFAIRSGARVVECTACGLQFAEDYPEYEDADSDIYSYDYLSPTIDKNPHRERIFAQLLAELESVVRARGRLLDIGTGEGTLLKVAIGRGWQAEGTEMSSAMIRHVHDHSDLTVHHGAVEDIALPHGLFDAVVLNHVLEHVKNPRTTMQKVDDLLRPGGVVRVEVPNLASLSSRLKNVQSRLRLKKDPWKHYSTGHHFWFFTPRTLRHTLMAAGLSVIALYAPASQWGGKHRFQNTVDGLFKRAGWGGHIVAYARGSDRSSVSPSTDVSSPDDAASE
jgi:2-polyprenyl-3-methyl-5-hydroxy-6-metoxy-1,4-benzoquinol methylase